MDSFENSEDKKAALEVMKEMLTPKCKCFKKYFATIPQKKFCDCSFNYYSNMKQRAMQKIKDYGNVIKKSNMGFAFIYFEKQTHKQDDMNDFKKFLSSYKSMISDQESK